MDELDVCKIYLAEQGFVIAEQELKNDVVRRFPYSEQVFRVCNVIVYQDEDDVKHLIKWRFDPRDKDYSKFNYEMLNRMERNRFHDLLNDKHFREIEHMLKNYFMQKYIIITDDFLNK